MLNFLPDEKNEYLKQICTLFKKQIQTIRRRTALTDAVLYKIREMYNLGFYVKLPQTLRFPTFFLVDIEFT